MASGYNRWLSPSQAQSPKRQRVKELREKFEALSDKSTGKVSGKESSQGHSRGHGSGRQTSGPSGGFSDSLEAPAEKRPSFSNVLESTRLDEREGRHPSGDEEPTGMDPEGFQYPPKKREDPEPYGWGATSGATGGAIGEFHYPAYTTQHRKAKESTKYGGMDYEQWYIDNLAKVTGFDMLCLDICIILSDYIPGIDLSHEYSPDALLGMLKDFIADMNSKLRQFDLNLSEVQGVDMADKIHAHKKKVMDVISLLEKQLEESKDQVSDLRRQLGVQNEQLISAEEMIEHLKANQEQGCATGYDKEFLERLKKGLSDSMCANYEQEIQQLREENKKLSRQLSQLSREKVENEEECMRDLSDASQEAHVNTKLREALESVLGESEQLEPNLENAEKVLNKWYFYIQKAMGQHEATIDELWQKLEATAKSRHHLAAKCEEQEEEIENFKFQIKKNKRIISSYQERKEQKDRNLSFSGSEDQNQSLSTTPGSSGEKHIPDSSGGTHSPESSSGTHSSETSGGTHSLESSGGTHSPGASRGMQSPVSSKKHSPASSERKQSPDMVPHGPGSAEKHSSKTTDKMLSTRSSDRKHGSADAKMSVDPQSPENQPIRSNIGRKRRGYSTGIIGKKPLDHSYISKPYFHSQGSGFGSDFSFEFPSPGYFGFTDSDRFDYVDDDYTPDSDALIREKFYIDGHLTPLPDDSIEDDSVFLPDDPEADRSMRKFFKQLKYRHILPSFGSDEGSVDDYKFHPITTEPLFLERMEKNFDYPESHPRHKGTFMIPNPRMAQYHYYPSPDGRKSFDSPCIEKPHSQRNTQENQFGYQTPEMDQYDQSPSPVDSFNTPYIAKPHSPSPQFGVPTPRMAQSASPGGRKSYDSPYIPRPYFASQSNYENDESFVFSEGSPVNSKTVTIRSPGRDEPLQLNVEVQPQNITESASGEHVICGISLTVQEEQRPIYEQETPKKIRRRGRKNIERGTPPVTPSRARDPRLGTPTSIFKKRHYGIRNLFDAEKDAPEYKSPAMNTTIEWGMMDTPEKPFDYSRQAPQTAWQNFSLTPTNDPEEQEMPHRWKKHSRLDAPETSAEWRPGQHGGASPPKELSQTYPYRYRPDTPPSPRTV